VQIWDHTDPAKFNIGADKGSGGLWNNPAGAAGKDPLVLADKPFGEWNHFRIRQLGSRTAVWLNEKLVVDNAILENYFALMLPIPPAGPIQLQTHGGEIRWRNIFLRVGASMGQLFRRRLGDMEYELEQFRQRRRTRLCVARTRRDFNRFSTGRILTGGPGRWRIAR